MKKPKTLIFAGYGLNCEEETKTAFELGGSSADIVHINDLIDGRARLDSYQILAFPGGFSFGDDTGSGNAYANRLRNHLWEKLQKFVQKDRLVIGICNGFQILVNLGLAPAIGEKYGERQVALTTNDSARYTNRWVDLHVENDTPWLRHLTHLSLPVAHGEGKLMASAKILQQLRQKKMIALRYEAGDVTTYLSLPPNPNGSTENIAGITDETGRILGLMPHPERGMFFTQLPHWTFLKEQYQRENKKIPVTAVGLQIFKNAVEYFQ